MTEVTRALIFEDQPDILGMMTELLETAGCEVVGSAMTIEQSRDLIDRQEPGTFDVALVDGNLSRGRLDRKEGAEIVRLLRKKFTNTVRIIGTSGAGDIEGVDANAGKMLSRNTIQELIINPD